MHRDILHLNIDAFPAAIEQTRHPELNGRPLVLGVPKGNTGGVVFSSSNEARRIGVTEELSLRRAQRICPDAIILPADHAVYRLAFDRFLELCSRYSPLLEPDALGRADLWWVICDYNDIFFPLELDAGIVLRVPSTECARMKLLD